MLEALGLSHRNLLYAALYDDTVLASGAIKPADLAAALSPNAPPADRLLALKILRRAICFEDYSRVVADHFGAVCRVLLLSGSGREMAAASALLRDFGRVEQHRPIILFNHAMLRDMLVQRPDAHVQRGVCAMLAWTLTDHFLEKQIRRLLAETDIGNYLHSVYLRSGDLLARRYALMCLKLARTGDVFDVATVEAFHHKLTAMAFAGHFTIAFAAVGAWTLARLAGAVRSQYRDLCCPDPDGKPRGALWHMATKQRAKAFQTAHKVPLPRLTALLRRGAVGGLVGGTLYVIQGPLCGLLTETRRFAFCHAHLLNKRKVAIAEQRGKQRRMPTEYKSIDGVCRDTMTTTVTTKALVLLSTVTLTRSRLGRLYLPHTLGPLCLLSVTYTLAAPHFAWI